MRHSLKSRQTSEQLAWQQVLDTGQQAAKHWLPGIAVAPKSCFSTFSKLLENTPATWMHVNSCAEYVFIQNSRRR